MQKPHRYGHVVATASNEQQDPVSVTKVKSSPNKLKWEKAMEIEMKSLQLNGVWELVELLLNRKIIGSKWIFKQKVDADGILVCYKARLPKGVPTSLGWTMKRHSVQWPILNLLNACWLWVLSTS